MQELLLCSDEDGWRCRKHPYAQPRTGGVCPVCLRARLLRLCPDCACERPCSYGCPSSSSTTSSSSLSSLSSVDPPRSSVDACIGAVGRVSHLIEIEPAFRRSRSVAFHLLRPRSGAAGGVEGRGGDPLRAGEGSKALSWLWPFSRASKKDAPEEEEDASEEESVRRVAAAVVRLSRSRSVGVVPAGYPVPGGIDHEGGVGGEVKLKGWNRFFPSPMKAFRHRKTAKIVQARSPLCRG